MKFPKKTAFIVCFLLLYIHSILGFEAYLKPLVTLQTSRLHLSDLVALTAVLEKDSKPPVLKNVVQNHFEKPTLITLNIVIDHYIKNHPILLSGQNTVIIPYSIGDKKEQIFFFRLLHYIEKNNNLPNSRLTITPEEKPYIPGDGEISFTALNWKYALDVEDKKIPFGEIKATYWISGNGPFYYTFDLKIEAPVAYAKTDIPYRSKITTEDLEFRLFDLSKAWDTPILENTDITGFQTKRRIYSGKMITMETLEVVQTVKVGDRLSIIIKNGPIKIEANGYALSSGNRGNTITVRVNRTGKQLQGVIGNKGEVFVEIED